MDTWGGSMRYQGLPWWLSNKESACDAGDQGLIPGSGRSSGEGNGTSLQDSHLENPMDRGACRTSQGLKESDPTEATEHTAKMRYEVKTKTVFLETGEEVILVVKWQGTGLEHAVLFCGKQKL